MGSEFQWLRHPVIKFTTKKTSIIVDQWMVKSNGVTLTTTFIVTFKIQLRSLFLYPKMTFMCEWDLHRFGIAYEKFS